MTPRQDDEVFIGSSEAISALRSDIERAARSPLSVLLVGETGTGKELAAQEIHRLSGRSGRLVVVNMATIAPSLAASAFFGHVRGAFSGAAHSQTGFVEAADGGTLFLDDIAEAPREVQSLLLQFTGSGEFMRIGATEARRADVRVIAATTEDLDSLVEQRRFRPDFAARLSGYVVSIPSLRQRKSDIPEIVRRELQGLCDDTSKAPELTADAMNALLDYAFPGNYRELRAILQRALAEADESTIQVTHLHLPKARVPVASARRTEALSAEVELLRSTSIRATPIWQGRDFPIQDDYCFVLMPFGDIRDLPVVYGDHVRPVVERIGLRCERADDIYDVSGVMQSVWEGINRARLVIADLTDRNPNVFYELGIAHTLGKPVVMLTQSIEFVPFDLRHLRAIIYSYTPRGMPQLELALERTIRTVLAGSAELRGA